MTNLHNLIRAIWDASVDAIMSVLQWLLDLLQSFVQDIFAWLTPTVEAILGPAWNLTAIEPALPFIDAITWFIPFYSILAIVGTSVGIMFTIRGTRWLLACIPTLSLG